MATSLRCLSKMKMIKCLAFVLELFQKLFWRRKGDLECCLASTVVLDLSAARLGPEALIWATVVFVYCQSKELCLPLQVTVTPVKPSVPWLRTEFSLGLPDTNLPPLFDVVKLKTRAVISCTARAWAGNITDLHCLKSNIIKVIIKITFFFRKKILHMSESHMKWYVGGKRKS